QHETWIRKCIAPSDSYKKMIWYITRISATFIISSLIIISTIFLMRSLPGVTHFITRFKDNDLAKLNYTVPKYIGLGVIMNYHIPMFTSPVWEVSLLMYNLE
ncbi:hypothetical protein PFISCL1PPCAC_11335, partial [Pristionchus fissidentatus]